MDVTFLGAMGGGVVSVGLLVVTVGPLLITPGEPPLPLLPVTENGDTTTRCVSMSRPALRRHYPTVLTGVKGLRCAPVLADGLRPHLTPAPLRRGLQ